ncbi:MAG TPA: hypothetical protein VGK44_04710 [Casimicrobiaceae bacterium]|jgi:hypothetical protein
MKRILVGMAFTLFALAPTMGLADCDYHKASMASSTPVARDELAQAPAASKTAAPAVAKTSVAKQVRHVGSKAMSSPSKAEVSTVVAKTN